MFAEKAVEILTRNTVFKPGWRVTARATGWREEVILGFEIDTVDTSYPDAEGRFQHRKTLVPERRLDVSGLDEAGLDYAVLLYAAQLDMHENREFLQHRQPDGTWKALLHPHTDAGERLFNRAMRQEAMGSWARV